MPRSSLLLVAALVAAIVLPSRVSANDEPRRWIKTPTGYLIVLRQGDDVMARLEEFVSAEKVPSASLVGIGFFSDVTFGFCDFGKKAFDPKSFTDVEVAGMTGSLAWKEGKPSIHAHATVTGRDFLAVGGHMLSAKVGTGSAEITVIQHDRELQRAVDAKIGANVLQLED